MKILHIIPGLHTGGAEMMLYKFLYASNHKAYQHFVVSFMEKNTIIGKKIEQHGFPVYSLNVTNKFKDLPFSICRMINVARNIKPDIFMGWMYHGNIAALAVAAILPFRSKVIWNIRHTPYNLNDEKKMTALMIRSGAKLSSRPDRIVYNASASRHCHKKIGYKDHKNMVIPNGFDCIKLKPDAFIKAKFRKSINVPRHAILIGLIGRYHPVKDHDNFFKAAAELQKNFLDVHFVLAGKNIDHDNFELAEMINKMSLHKNVHLLGERDDITKVMPAFDVVTSSSRSEAFPNTIGEAMACGIPCVVTDVGDSAWIVGDTGIVVPKKKPNALAAGWTKIINMDNENRTKLGESARHRISDNFSLPVIVKKYEEIFESICYIRS